MSDTSPSPNRQKDEATPLAPLVPRRERFTKRIRHALLGKPLHSSHMEHTLLPKFLALPVFASDAISSCAYATQEIILVFGAVGLADFAGLYEKYTLSIAASIILLLVIVVTSYWQTIFAYPRGGGSYIVTSDNLGTRWGINWGLLAGASLLTDYILTVAVSIAAGVQNLAGIPFMAQHFHVAEFQVLFCLLFIGLLTLANLRGLKESGAVFATFTYGFVAMCLLMFAVVLIGPAIGWSAFRGDIDATLKTYATLPKEHINLTGVALLALILRAFSSGCTAMTGVEAVCDGIPAFREPKAKNAALTLLAMGVILGTIFLGVSWLTMRFGIVYFSESLVNGRVVEGAPAVIDQISGAVFGKSGTWSFAYLLTQFMTAGILVLAANTAFADFPRLASFMARDRFMPKQFANVGDKLVFNNGIVILGVLAGLLIVLFRGHVDNLIPLYAVGVFLAFTLSQSAMVVHWIVKRSRAWQRKAVINGIGAFATFVVLLTITIEKFTHGAWAIIVLLFILYKMFCKIHRHYVDVAHQLKIANIQAPQQMMTNTVLVLVPSLHKGILPALNYARSLSADCRAIHMETDPENTPRLREHWEAYGDEVPLVILNSPFRSLVGPIMRYLDAVQVERKNHIVTVVVPEFVSTKWWHKLLHGNSGLLMRLALQSRKDVIVTSVRYYLNDTEVPDESALEEEIQHISTAQLVMENHPEDDN